MGHMARGRMGRCGVVLGFLAAVIGVQAMPALTSFADSGLEDMFTTVDTKTIAGPPVSVSTVTTTVDTNTGAVASTATVDGKTNVDIREGTTATIATEEPCPTTMTSTTTSNVETVMSPGVPPCANKDIYEKSQANIENLPVKEPVPDEAAKPVP